jgi:hypothetical protein
MNKILIILSLVVLINVDGTSQISEGGTPYSLQNEVLNASGRSAFKTTDLTLSEVSNEFQLNRSKKLMEECETCRRDYYGTGIDVRINLIKDGSFQDLGENGKIWLTTISSKNAFGMQFYFNRYKLPDGAKLFLYNEDKSMILGAFTSRNNHEDGKFATQVISGQKIVIEYFEPRNSGSLGELEIYKVIHAFKEVYPKYRTNYYGESGDCNIDINCPDGANYQDIKRGVCRISYYDNSLELAAHCTGSLLNTTKSALSRQGVILTANHCVTPYDMTNPSVANHKKYRVAEWIFEFGYEISDCNNPMDPFAITKTMNGASIISKGALSDYALLDLGSTPPPSYDVVYLGWDRDYSSVPSKAVGIHHPSGDVKKISLENDLLIPVHTQTTAGTQNFYETQGTPFTDWKITWNKGVTEGGSSGSPLFNQNKKIVGQLRGGTSACPSTYGPDYYGRLAISWNNPDPEYSSWPLSYWLDYNNTGVKSLASYDPSLSTPANCSNGVIDGDETGIDCGGSSCSPCHTQYPSTCNNGVQDNGEDGIDCGGGCLSCPTGSCVNGIRDGDETGIDCGGIISNCKPCAISTLNPGVVLGNFNYGNECFGECKLTTVATCQNEGWKINHGRVLLAYGHDNNHIVLLADPSPTHPNDGEFGTGIYKNYIFEKGKKYLLSFRLLTGKYYSPDYTGGKAFNNIRKFEIRLTNSIVGNICRANVETWDPYYAANVADERQYYYDIQAQVIFATQVYKNDFNEGKDWQTIVIEFTPDADYSQIWLINAPFNAVQTDLSDDTEWLRIDDVVLFDRDTFFNPCCENEQTISSTSNILLNPSANYLVNVSAGTGSIILASNQSASITARKIVLNPGFRAMEGSIFTARAGYCPKNVLFNTESLPFPAGTKPYGVINETAITTNSFLEACMLPQNRALNEDPEFGRVFMDEDYSDELDTEDQISISPNPTQGNFKIKASFEQEAKTVDISVISLSGNTISSSRYKSVEYLMQEIDISQFPQGIYLIRITRDNKTIYRKVVKM